MKYSYNWLKKLSGIEKTLEKVSEDLTFHSFEIENVEKGGMNLAGVVVAEILEIKKHPNADKLQLVTLQTSPQSSPSEGEEIIEVVCGAPNIAVGQKVPLALVGTKLPASPAGGPNGIEIKEAEIRGVKSRGMLCAEDELGLGNDHSGIIILSQNAKIGEAASKYLGKSDDVIEIKVLPDRAHDAMSHVGVAREISVLEGKKMDYDFDGLKLPKTDSKMLKVEIKDKDLCPRYIGAIMTGVEIKESPDWMKERLRACGMNAINNVVDATNYIMLELGQPLHAFDKDKMESDTILVRCATEGEEINLLDKGVQKLSTSNLLITDGKRPAALAGIKGARIAEIDNSTKNIVLEAANFNATNIRKTRTKLGIKTESSDRFEKDIDPNLAEKAMVRLIEVIEHTAGGKLEEIVDVYPDPVKPWKVKLNLDYVNSLLGEIIPAKDVKKILTLLDFKVNGSGKNISVEVPTFRVDVRTQEDLIEEIGRIWGYEKIKNQSIISTASPAKINEQIFFERKIQDVLTGMGYDEVYNYSFYSKADAEKCRLKNAKHFELANPMNPDQELVRVSLIPNILKNIKENLKHFGEFGIFEEAKVYSPEEKRILALARVLEQDRAAQTFFELKGAAESMLDNLKIQKYSFEEASLGSFWHKTRSAEIRLDGKIIGCIGEIDPQVLSNYRIKNRVAVAEFDLEVLQKLSDKTIVYEPLNKFPSVFRDISMIDKSGVKAAEIVSSIKKTGGNFIQNVELFDVYKKENETSLAYHIEFNAGSRTLEGKEVDEIMQKIISELEKNLKVEIRK